LSIRFDSVVVGPIETNCYVAWDSDTLDAAIIDPGGDEDRILAAIDRAQASAGGGQLNVAWVLLTHGHFDHTFSTGSILSRFPARTAMQGSDLDLLDDGLEIASLYYDMTDYVSFQPSDLVQDGQVIQLGRSEIEVIHTPGHSKGSVCYMTDAGLFCGDTVFAGTIGRTDFPEGSYSQIIESIRGRIAVLDDSTPLMPGHGVSTTVGQERTQNPFF